MRARKGVESTFKEIIAKNIPNVGKEMDIHTQEAQIPQQNQGGLYQDT